MRGLLAIAICLSVVPLAAAPGEAKSRREKTTLQFESFWNARLAEYRGEASRKAGEHKAASDAILSGVPFNFSHDDARLGRLIRSSEDDARVSGRGVELDAFISHIASRPSIGLSQAYLQGRVEKARQAEETANQAQTALAALVAANGVTVGRMLAAIEQTAMARGEAIGRVEELRLLIENYNAYSADFAAANERDRESRARWAAALGGAARSLASQPTFSVSCNRMGNMVNCMGR